MLQRDREKKKTGLYKFIELNVFKKVQEMEQ